GPRASRRTDRPRFGASAAPHQKVSPPVDGPRQLVVAGIHRLLLTVGGSVDAARVDAQRDQVGLGRLSPLLTERHVVLDSPALVGMPLDRHRELRVALERLGQLVERRLRLACQTVLVELEVDVLERRPKRGRERGRRYGGNARSWATRPPPPRTRTTGPRCAPAGPGGARSRRGGPPAGPPPARP